MIEDIRFEPWENVKAWSKRNPSVAAYLIMLHVAVAAVLTIATVGFEAFAMGILKGFVIGLGIIALWVVFMVIRSLIKGK